MFDSRRWQIEHSDPALGTRRGIFITEAEKLQGKGRRVPINEADISDSKDLPNASVIR